MFERRMYVLFEDLTHPFEVGGLDGDDCVGPAHLDRTGEAAQINLQCDSVISSSSSNSNNSNSNSNKDRSEKDYNTDITSIGNNNNNPPKKKIIE